MKLKIKHLSAYLPYELKVVDPRFNDISEMTSKNLSSDKYISLPTLIDLCNLGLHKPVLFPMSDLGSDMFNNIISEFTNIPNFEHFWRVWKLDTDLSETIIEYCVFDKLCSKKFDVFNLINKGLAISVHDLINNPYFK